MNPYDLLDVAPDATDDEISAAWKAAIADLGPADRRFRAYNQAAELLLDPERRAAYDAELAAEEPDREPEAAPVPTAPVVEKASPLVDAGSGDARVVPTWLLLALAAVTLLVISATAYVATRPSDSGVEEATRAAQSAAERAMVPVLSYDAGHLEADQAAAQKYLTSDYRKQYDQLFEVIKNNAPGTETVVIAEVIASGIVRSGEDRVEVLLFVNQATTNKQEAEPIIYKNQVRVQMEKVGDEWLVDCLITTPDGDCG